MASFQYYTKQQADALHRMREVAGGYEFDREWRRLISDIRSRMAKDPNPESPAASALAARWQQLVARFTGGNAEIEVLLYNAAREWHRHESGEGHAIPGLLSYIKKAIAASGDS